MVTETSDHQMLDLSIGSNAMKIRASNHTWMDRTWDNASDSWMVKKNSDELRSDLASDSSRDLIYPGLEEVGYYNFHVGFPLTVL